MKSLCVDTAKTPAFRARVFMAEHSDTVFVCLPLYSVKAVLIVQKIWKRFGGFARRCTYTRADVQTDLKFRL